MNQSAYDFLIKEKTRKSKLDNLSYTDLRTQSYLMSGNISTRKKKLIFKVRTRMVQVGDNFGKKEDLCRICLLELNTQSHLTQCSVLKVKYPEIFKLYGYLWYHTRQTIWIFLVPHQTNKKMLLIFLKSVFEKGTKQHNKTRYNLKKDQVQF